MVCWSVILGLFESVIGRAIFVLWLALPVVNMSEIFDYKAHNYKISLIGASIIAIAYVIVKVISPVTIKQYKSHKEYVDYLLVNSDSILIADEFKVVSTCDANKVPTELKEYLPINDNVTVLGLLKCIRLYGKYSYIISDKSSPVIRFIIMMLFIVGIIFMLYPTLNAVIQLLGVNL